LFEVGPEVLVVTMADRRGRLAAAGTAVGRGVATVKVTVVESL